MRSNYGNFIDARTDTCTVALLRGNELSHAIIRTPTPVRTSCYLLICCSIAFLTRLNRKNRREVMTYALFLLIEEGA